MLPRTYQTEDLDLEDDDLSEELDLSDDDDDLSDSERPQAHPLPEGAISREDDSPPYALVLMFKIALTFSWMYLGGLLAWLPALAMGVTYGALANREIGIIRGFFIGISSTMMLVGGAIGICANSVLVGYMLGILSDATVRTCFSLFFAPQMPVVLPLAILATVSLLAFKNSQNINRAVLDITDRLLLLNALSVFDNIVTLGKKVLHGLSDIYKYFRGQHDYDLVIDEVELVEPNQEWGSHNRMNTLLGIGGLPGQAPLLVDVIDENIHIDPLPPTHNPQALIRTVYEPTTTNSAVRFA